MVKPSDRPSVPLDLLFLTPADMKIIDVVGEELAVAFHDGADAMLSVVNRDFLIGGWPPGS